MKFDFLLRYLSEYRKAILNTQAFNFSMPQIGTKTDELTPAADYACDAKSESTRRAYRSDWQDFEKWCAPRGLAVLPAEVGTVAAYLVSLVDGGLKASTITRRCASIAYAHRLTSAAPPTRPSRSRRF